MLKKLVYLLIFTIAIPLASSAQSTKQKLSQAKEFFYHEKYSEALAILNSSRKLSRTDKEARLLIAVCQFQLNQLDIALQSLETIVAEKKQPYPECWLYLGKVLHAMHKFDDAANYYKLFLRTIRPDHPLRKMVREEIRRCANGIDVQYRQSLALVENLGIHINTEGDEFAPVPSRNQSDKLYFSSIRYGNTGGARDDQNSVDDRFGNFLSDMFSCNVKKGQWTNVAPMHYFLNSPQHEVLLDFNREGTVMYYFKGWGLNRGQIVIDTFKTYNNRKLSSTPFISPMDVVDGDQNLFIHNDTLLVFSSRRAGGSGGYDLYQSSFRNGRWTSAKNMGSEINSAYDETHPYLAPDGKTLFFSSNDSRKSIGGYDIFKTVFVANTQRWSDPFNVGIPINSAGDDSGFRLTNDGFTAFFTSSRKDGFGKRDLYIAYFQEYLKEVEGPIVAFIPPPPPPEKIKPENNQPNFANRPPSTFKEDTFEKEKVIEAPPVQTNPNPQPEQIPQQEAQNSGFPTIYLDGRNDFDYSQKIALDPIVQVLRDNPQVTVVITSYTMQPGAVPQRLFRAINYAEEAAKYLQVKSVSPKNIYLRAMDGSKTKQNNPFAIEFSFVGIRNTPLEGKVPVIGDHYQSLVPDMVTGKGLFYKVQIYSVTKVLTRSILSDQPYPMIEKTPDFAYYRYTLGAFENYKDAKAFSKEIQRQGQKGAYVVPFINGKRADKNETKRNTGNFPDLENYLKG
jgi:tetratricopeptide (TPR) repeat protein